MASPSAEQTYLSASMKVMRRFISTSRLRVDGSSRYPGQVTGPALGLPTTTSYKCRIHRKYSFTQVHPRYIKPSMLAEKHLSTFAITITDRTRPRPRLEQFQLYISYQLSS